MNYYKVSFRADVIEQCDCEFCEGHERQLKRSGKVLAIDEAEAQAKIIAEFKRKTSENVLDSEILEIVQLSEAEMLQFIGATPLPLMTNV